MVYERKHILSYIRIRIYLAYDIKYVNRIYIIWQKECLMSDDAFAIKYMPSVTCWEITLASCHQQTSIQLLEIMYSTYPKQTRKSAENTGSQKIRQIVKDLFKYNHNNVNAEFLLSVFLIIPK